MSQILLCDWLPKRVRWVCLTRTGLLLYPARNSCPVCHINKSVIDQLVWSRWLVWLDICVDRVFMVRVYGRKKDLGQLFRVILSSRLVNAPYISIVFLLYSFTSYFVSVIPMKMTRTSI